MSAKKPPATTFSLTIEDSLRIDALRADLAREAVLVNRSEVVRLGLLALEAANASGRQRLVRRLQRRRPGRQPQEEKATV